jgi:hypothetical protein
MYEVYKQRPGLPEVVRIAQVKEDLKYQGNH